MKFLIMLAGILWKMYDNSNGNVDSDQFWNLVEDHKIMHFKCIIKMMLNQKL